MNNLGKYIALGTPEEFAKLGDFNVSVDGNIMDVYYNLDLGEHRTSMFDMDSKAYKNLENAHRSFHYSGRGHFKESTDRSARPLFIGHISDGSVLNNLEKDPLILGIESFLFNFGASTDSFEPDTLFLQPPKGAEQYSIAWLWVPADFPKTIHPRWFYVNLREAHGGYTWIRSAALADIALAREMQTVLAINSWEIRALFLKSLLPVMNKGVILVHPKGRESAWRAYASLDAHLPLAQMLHSEACKKKALISTELPYIPKEEASSPWALVKKKAGK